VEVKVDGVVNADARVIPPLQLPLETTKKDASTDANETFIVVLLLILVGAAAGRRHHQEKRAHRPQVVSFGKNSLCMKSN